ncbi:MAG: phytanoyl-CoA dioxygenase family protein [Chitinophagales bacterium]
MYELKNFWKNGFAGPFDLNVDSNKIEKVADFLSEMVQSKKPHPLYHRYSVRDWHLLKQEVLSLYQDEGLVESLKVLMGEDLVLWRTKVFNKEPFEGEIGWHQEWGTFNGIEIGNDIPALQYSGDEECWDLTVWVALCDVELNMGPLKFARGTNNKRFTEVVTPMYESEFFVDPFVGISSVSELVKRALSNALILDVDTSTVFTPADLNNANLSMEAAQEKVMEHIKNAKGSVVIDFNPEEHEIITSKVKKGQYWIFTERVMHGSGVNESDRSRLGINGRITRSDTLIYPQRLEDGFMDGSNIDISQHECVLLSGKSLEPRNKMFEARDKSVVAH